MLSLLRALRDRLHASPRPSKAVAKETHARLLSAGRHSDYLDVEIGVLAELIGTQAAGLLVRQTNGTPTPLRVAAHQAAPVPGGRIACAYRLMLGALDELAGPVDTRIARYNLTVELADGRRARIVWPDGINPVEADAGNRTIQLVRRHDGDAALALFRRRRVPTAARPRSGPSRRAIVFAGSLSYRNGKTKALLQIAASLAAAGHEVRVLTVFPNNDPPAFPLADIVGLDHVAHPLAAGHERLVASPEAEAHDPAALERLIELYMRGTDADVVVCTWPHVRSFRASLPPSAKVVLTDHDGRCADLVEAGTCGDGYLEAIRLADAIHVVNPLMADVIQPLTSRPVTATGNVVDVAAVLDEERIFAVRTIMAAGRLVPVKRMHHVIDAFASVAERRPGWTLDIYGDGPEEAALAARIRERGLDGRARLRGFDTALERRLAEGAVLVSASRVEAFPLNVAEAIAAGCPVIGYDRAIGNRLLLGDGAGLLVPDGRRRRLAAAMETICREIEDRDRAVLSRIERARQRAAEFSPAAIADAWGALVTRLTAD